MTREVREIFAVTRDVLGPPRLTRDGRQVVYSRRTVEADIWLLTYEKAIGANWHLSCLERIGLAPGAVLRLPATPEH